MTTVFQQTFLSTDLLFKSRPRCCREQSWALSIFLNFFNNKKIFKYFLPSELFYFCTSPIKKPTTSQINFIKNAKKSFFISGKVQKYRKCPALVGKYIQKQTFFKWNTSKPAHAHTHTHMGCGKKNPSI